MIIVAYDKNEHLIYTYDDYSKTSLNVSIVTEKLNTKPLLNGENFMTIYIYLKKMILENIIYFLKT